MTPVFAHLSEEGRLNFNYGLTNQILFVGIFGKDLTVGHLDSTDFGHLKEIRKEDFDRKFKEIHVIQSCTEIECQEFGTVTQTDEELHTLYAKSPPKIHLYWTVRKREPLSSSIEGGLTPSTH